MSSNDDHIYQYPEASLAKRKDTGMYLSRDEWWAMNRLGKIKGVDYQYSFGKVIVPSSFILVR
jgi:hypothetical protein